MIENILKIIARSPHVAISSLMPVIALMAALYRKPYWDRTSKLIVYFLIFVIITDIPLWITAGLKIHNVFYSALLDTSTFLFISFIYYKEGTVRVSGKLVYLLCAILVLHLLLQLTRIITPGAFLWINRIVLFSFVLSYLYGVIADPKIKDIMKYPFFWFNAGSMMYSCGSLLVTLFYRYTLSPESDKALYFKYFYLLSHIIVIVFYTFVAASFLVSKRNINSK